jgi:nucleoside-diphosphate-sugar epimerase
MPDNTGAINIGQTLKHSGIIMANYLVTGGGGFIGSNIVRVLLEQNESVRVLENFSTGYRRNLAPFENRIDLVEGDLRSAEDCTRAVADIDYVLHQGAIPSVPRSVADPQLSHEANSTGTLNLLIAARDAGVKRLVFASSSSIYGDQPTEYKTESLPIAPQSPYAGTKAAGEHYLRAFSRCFGLETVALRYFNVFGPNQDPDSPYSAVIPLFIKAILEGKSPTVHGDGLQARDFTFVENNVHANILAATGNFEARGQAFNIACGASYNLLELIDGINSVLGTNLKPVHTEARVGDIRVSKADISRAQEQLQYEVIVPFREGLQKTIEWYMQMREK